MSDINKIRVDSVDYNISDLVARDKVKSATLSLLMTGWDSSSKEQTVSVNGVTDSNFILVPPIQEEYESYNILCEKQSDNSLTFSCESIPNTDISIQILIFNP